MTFKVEGLVVEPWDANATSVVREGEDAAIAEPWFLKTLIPYQSFKQRKILAKEKNWEWIWMENSPLRVCLVEVKMGGNFL